MKFIKFTLILLLYAFPILGQKFNFAGEIGIFSKASAFYINPRGFIYVTDSDRDEIIKLDTLGNIVKFIGGYGWSQSAFDDPVDVFATTLNVYVSDKNNNRIQILDKDLNFLYEFNTRKYENPTYKFAYPTSCSVSNQGDLFVLDSDNSRILKYDLRGDFLLEIGNYDAGSFALTNPKAFAISPDSKLFVIDGNELVVFDQFGTGLLKMDPGFEPSNINITFAKLVLNNVSTIKYLDLTNPGSALILFTTDQEGEEGEIVESLIFNNKLYILTENKILIYKRLKQ